MNLGQVHDLGGVTNIENEKKWVFLIRDVQGMGILFFSHELEVLEGDTRNR